MFVVNWPEVGCFEANSNVLDDFQVIIIDRADRGTGPNGDDFDLEYNYNSIQWDTGQASGGDANCQNGPAGNSAYVGYTNGTDTPGDFFELPGSGVPNAYLDSSTTTGLIYNSLNSTTLGRYLFTVVNGQPTQTTSLSTSLSGVGQSGADISVPGGTAVSDSSTLSGTNAGSATGSVTYNVYSDPNCTQLVSGPDQESITTAGTMPGSQAVTLNAPGTYYWQATYSGDSTNDGSVSPCGAEVETVVQTAAPTSLTTSLTGGGQSGGSITVAPGTAVADSSSLSGANAATATGGVTYSVYSDAACTQLVSGPDQESIATPGSLPDSQAVSLNSPGTYYWQAVYGGDSANAGSSSSCGSEVETVSQPSSPQPTSVDTQLTGGGNTNWSIIVPDGSSVTDQATLSGANVASAGGTVTYQVYSDSICSVPAAPASTVGVVDGVVPASAAVSLPTGNYYWTVTYSGDASNDPSADSCFEHEVVLSGARFGADVGVGLAIQPASPPVGSQFVICVTVANYGPKAAGHVFGGVLLPAGVTVVNPAGATQIGRLLYWKIGSMTVGETITYEVWVSDASPGSVKISDGALSLSTIDPNYHNNFASESVTVNGPRVSARRVSGSSGVLLARLRVIGRRIDARR